VKFRLYTLTGCSDLHIDFGRILVSNNIVGCGEYKVYKMSPNDYLLACTRDGKNWKYYELKLNEKSVEKYKSININKPY